MLPLSPNSIKCVLLPKGSLNSLEQLLTILEERPLPCWRPRHAASHSELIPPRQPPCVGIRRPLASVLAQALAGCLPRQRGTPMEGICPKPLPRFLVSKPPPHTSCLATFRKPTGSTSTELRFKLQGAALQLPVEIFLVGRHAGTSQNTKAEATSALSP